jgi:hypothetical protein
MGVTETGIANGILAGAATRDEVDTNLLPSMANTVAAIIQRDCTGGGPPGCGCTSGSAGKTLLAQFDANQNCAVSVDELKSNLSFQSQLAPDVTIDGQQALSFGFGISAVHADFTP